ncbi:MAG: hypothetical protein IJS94_00510, partial [Clostridia bacterium]|nr:hypothetical protein [Clostridia bacterium]
EVDSLDATLILKYDAGLIDFTEEELIAAEVIGDDEVNSLDAIHIYQYDAGLRDDFEIYNA